MRAAGKECRYSQQAGRILRFTGAFERGIREKISEVLESTASPVTIRHEGTQLVEFM